MHLLTAQGLVGGGGCRIVFQQPFLMFILPTFEAGILGDITESEVGI